MNEPQLFAVNMGSFALDGGAMFGRVPKTLWEKQYSPPDARNRIPMALRALLVRWNDNGTPRALLVDAGTGDKSSEKRREIFDIQPNPKALHDVGLNPDGITDVLFTHLHFDHCGGGTKYAAGSKSDVVPAFPKATYYTSKEQRAYSRAPSLLDRASFWTENYDPLDNAGRLQLLEPPFCPWPHIKLLQFFGHTRGLILPLINVGDKTVLFAGDLIPTRAHVRLPWIMGYDLNADETLAEKSFVLELAAENHWGLFLDHDAHTELVTVKRDDADYTVERQLKLSEFLSA
jgi:glyoxylase-like metal-dependent hydrolase (beta-lactamase superfamily II)